MKIIRNFSPVQLPGELFDSNIPGLILKTVESGSPITLDADLHQYDYCKESDADNTQAKLSRSNYKKGKIILTLFGIFFIVLFAYYTIAGNSPRPSDEP